MKKLFGTDGIRGEAGAFPLNEKTIEVVGNSLARQFTEKLGRSPRFVVGRDTRESGKWIEQAFCEGASAAEADCESAGVITTPGVAFLTGKFHFDAGVVVSASHNPYQDNGIKIFLPDGKKIDELIEREIEKDIYAVDIENQTVGELGELDVRAKDYQQSYLDYLADEFKALNLNGYKIVMDCANGAACQLAPQLFQKFGAEVVAINTAPDGKNINKNCGSLHLENLQKKVSEEKANFGVAFDGDADRALFVDERGNVADGDAVLWVMANHLRAIGKLNNDTVIATVMSNIGLEIALQTVNIRLVRTDVGDKYVLAELLKTDSSIGGEQSGHIIFPRHSLVGDGMLTTLFLLEAIQEKGKTLSQMTEGFVKYPQILVNVKVREKRLFEEVPEIAAAARAIENQLAGKGRLLLRYSGTENLARVMIEGENQTEIERQANHLAEIIRETLG
jgi:phosphoglucosamine mutase